MLGLAVEAAAADVAVLGLAVEAAAAVAGLGLVDANKFDLVSSAAGNLGYF